MTITTWPTFILTMCVCVLHMARPVLAAEVAVNTMTLPAESEPDNSDIAVQTLQYRETPQGALQLTVYALNDMKDDEALPGVVLYYGGGWIGGTPKQFEPFALAFVRRGMVVVTPEYRVSKTHRTSPFASVEDAFASFRFVRANAARFGIDPNRLSAGGGSAGGHLAAALATLDPDVVGGEKSDVDPMPDALLLWNPVYDNSPAGYGFDRINGRVADFSPLHNINADMPPTLVMLGDQDNLIPVATAESFRDKQRALGVRSELIVYPGAVHGFFNFDRGQEHFLATSMAAQDFLQAIGHIEAQQGAATRPTMSKRETRPANVWKTAEILFEDDFEGDLSKWTPEIQEGVGEIRAGKLHLDVSAGCTFWFNQVMEGPLMIAFEATAIGKGGVNDRVSDLNCFWMARDARNPEKLFDVKRSGDFGHYNQLMCYYVGYGGNSNGTTRFRRYIGDQENRPLRPEHDLGAEQFLITPNKTMKIQLVAFGDRIEYWRDGERIFELVDPESYTSGWFGFRTVMSHIQFDNFKVYRLESAE